MQRPTHIDTTTTHLTDARKKYYANLNNSKRTGSLSTIYVKHLNALKLSHSECALSLSCNQPVQTINQKQKLLLSLDCVFFVSQVIHIHFAHRALDSKKNIPLVDAMLRFTS